jgi:hypothetical protein
MKIKTAAHAYDIHRGTLGDRLEGILPQAESAKERRHLDETEDLVLHEFVYLQIDHRFPPTIDMIGRAATTLLRRKKACKSGLPRTHPDTEKLCVGKNWVNRWPKRAPELYARRVRALESKRVIQSTPDICYGFLDKLLAVTENTTYSRLILLIWTKKALPVVGLQGRRLTQLSLAGNSPLPGLKPAIASRLPLWSLS